MFEFQHFHQHTHSRARLGKITTRHGIINTPAFMPVGTQATVKSLSPEDLESCKTQIILSNTYHLYLRPGEEILKKIGGLHRFMNWNKPVLTDSGGFQIFSLSRLAKTSDEGVTFQSHIDGSKHNFTPERVMEIQQTLGADIVMTLDEMAGHLSDYKSTLASLKRTTQWAKRCRSAHKDDTQTLFGIVQGGISKKLRDQSVKEIIQIGFKGYAIGGLSVGEEMDLIINGLTNLNHPVQILTDIFTIWEKRNQIKGIKVAYVGDGNNIAYSWSLGASIMEMDLTIASPPELQPVIPKNHETLGKVEIITDPFEAVKNADIIYTDVWVSMGDNSNIQKKVEYLKDYQINKDLLAAAKSDVLVMHCLPAHRGEEITSEVLDGKHSIVFDQAENRLHVQKAILDTLL